MERREALGSALGSALGPALGVGAGLVSTGCASPPPATNAELVRAVTEAERAFAQTMVARDLEAFAAFVADEAVFFGGGRALVGRAAVRAGWAPFFDGPAPPFTWAPDRVVVLASGTLAHSTGPVTGADGKVGTRFHSTWRLEPDGRWRVVFDEGTRVCP